MASLVAIALPDSSAAVSPLEKLATDAVLAIVQRKVAVMLPTLALDGESLAAELTAPKAAVSITATAPTVPQAAANMAAAAPAVAAEIAAAAPVIEKAGSLAVSVATQEAPSIEAAVLMATKAA